MISLYVGACTREAQLIELNLAKKPDCVTLDIFDNSPSVIITLPGKQFFLFILCSVQSRVI